MRTNIFQNLLLAIVSIGLIAFVGYQVYGHFTDNYETETVYSYVVEESTRVSGVVLRDEVVIDEKVGRGISAYLANDGTKLSIGSPIAEFYTNESEAQKVHQLRELENRRALLAKAQDPGATSYAQTDALNKQIVSELSNIIDAVNNENLSDVSASSDKLYVLMNTKQIAVGKQANFSTAISQLVTEENYLKKQISSDATVIKSPRQGYFIRKIDGLEGKVDMANLGSLTPADLFDLTNTPVPPNAEDMVGKLMISHNWYYAARIPSEELDKYQLGASVTLNFNVAGANDIAATISHVNSDSTQEEALVIFRSDFISDVLVNLRVAQADVKFKSIRGLRISKSAIQFNGMEKGVYVVVGERMEFKPIEVIYEEFDYAICKEDTGEIVQGSKQLQQYDEVIVKGTDLSDNKRIE